MTESAPAQSAVRSLGARALVEWGVLVALAALLTLGAVRWSVVARLDAALYDAVVTLHGHAPRDDIVIVAIDDQSLDAVGRWPWPRSRLADLIARVGQARPRAIGVDILLIEPDLVHPEGDRALIEAIRQAGHVILPALPERTEQGRVYHYPFLGINAAVAHINAAPDADSVVRGMYLAEGPSAHLLDHLAVQLAQALRSPASVPALADVETDAGGWTRRGHIRLNFAGQAGTYRHVPALDVLNGHVAPDALAGKLVLIGATASGVSDIFATPPSRTMSGVEVLANATQTALDSSAILPVSPGVFWAMTLLPLLMTAFAVRWLTPRMALAVALAGAAVLLLSAIGALVFGNRWLPPFAALVGPLVLYPLWSWRQQEAALRFLRDEMQRLAREPGLLGETASLERPGRTLGAHMDAVASLTDKLRALRRFLADALESLPDATVVCTHDGTIRLANGRSADLAGQSQTPGQNRAAALRDLPTLLARAFPDPSAGEHYWARWLTDPTGLEPVELQTHDGRSMLMHAAALRDEAGRPVDIIVSFADITPVRQAERHREEALRFISHDMRSPQSAILALIELQRDASRALDREVLLSRIEQLSSRTLELADAFIDLARAESQTLKLVDVDLVGLVLDAADEVWPLANRHQVEVRVVADIEAAVRGEPRLLVRALVNLLNNAIKFSAAGSLVTVTVEQDEAMLSVAVADQGAGIALADQPRLFQPFHRLHEGAANAPAGSGLGLVFVKTVVDRHGGRIAVQSAPGLGSTFTLWLPRVAHRHDA
ncbi:Sensor histidine kinase RcsC [Ralstonia sp. LMG 32965]|uniref:CHASE2 domain-containing protein n=1 Tax=Ralstonia flatus TaxID=3058601 RepID=UPI0028F513EB|nr:CHASE2 domain-containing protein [Ralstonia sp. LMG 32965]CAJ0897737.1 Sensor histidine kinase RcsC [Ralstonia sp. LMG 32965]